MLATPVNILFVSLRNTVRSTLAQACLSRHGAGRFRAYACGVPGPLGQAPASAVEKALAKAGMAATQQECLDWTPFTRLGAVKMNYVITLAEEATLDQPPWPSQRVTAVWLYDDVFCQATTPETLDKAIWDTLFSLRRRIELLVSLPMHKAPRSALRDDIRDMAHMQ
jgi:arsenate reductase